MARDRIVKAGAIAAADVPQPPATGGFVPPSPEMLVGDVLGASIDPSVALPVDVTVNVTVDPAPDAAAVVEASKPKAKKAEPTEPRQATVAEMMAQSLRNHKEHTDRAAAVAELQRQLKNL